MWETLVYKTRFISERVRKEASPRVTEGVSKEGKTQEAGPSGIFYAPSQGGG